MNRDLEDTLAELGGGYRPLVARLKRAYEPFPAAVLPRHRSQSTRWLVAASLLMVFAFAVVFLKRDESAAVLPSGTYTDAYVGDSAAIAAIVAAQRPDGSWQNDFLTRQNATALSRGENAATRAAYKKALRYLRSKGLAPLTEEEFRSCAERARRGRVAFRASPTPGMGS